MRRNSTGSLAWNQPATAKTAKTISPKVKLPNNMSMLTPTNRPDRKSRRSQPQRTNRLLRERYVGFTVSSRKQPGHKPDGADCHRAAEDDSGQLAFPLPLRESEHQTADHHRDGDQRSCDWTGEGGLQVLRGARPGISLGERARRNDCCGREDA